VIHRTHHVAHRQQLARIEFILDSGTGAMRQLQVWNANRDIVEVAQEIAAATEAV